MNDTTFTCFEIGNTCFNVINYGMKKDICETFWKDDNEKNIILLIILMTVGWSALIINVSLSLYRNCQSDKKQSKMCDEINDLEFKLMKKSSKIDEFNEKFNIKSYNQLDIEEEGVLFDNERETLPTNFSS